MGVLIDNPVMSVQLHLRGGWKNLFITAGTYALIIFAAMGLWAELDPRHVTSSAEGWTVLLMLIQTGLVLLFSIVRVNNSVRNDITSGIMESHRLMPVTGLTACVGYVVGPALQMIAIGVVTCLAGVVSSTVAGLDSSRWVKANAVMLAFLLFTCTCSMLVGFYRRALFHSLIVFIVITCFSAGMLLYALPGLAILVSPLAGDSVFDPRGKLDLFNPGFQWAFAGQAMIAGIMLAAASRKFRQPERPAFSISLSLILLAAWVLLNLIGFQKWSDIEPVYLRYNMAPGPGRMRVQFTAGSLSAILLCILPIAAAVREHREKMEGNAKDQPRRSRVTSRIATILICASLVCFLLVILPSHGHKPDLRAIAEVAASMIAAVVSLGALLSAYRSTARKVTMVVVVFLLGTWVAPLFTDVIRHSLLPSHQDYNNTSWSITAYGPIGTMLSPWDSRMQTAAGLDCQMGIAVVLVFAALLAERSRRRKPLALVLETLPIPEAGLAAPPPQNAMHMQSS
jgi:hypothetical protein